MPANTGAWCTRTYRKKPQKPRRFRLFQTRLRSSPLIPVVSYFSRKNTKERDLRFLRRHPDLGLAERNRREAGPSTTRSKTSPTNSGNHTQKKARKLRGRKCSRRSVYARATIKSR